LPFLPCSRPRSVRRLTLRRSGRSSFTGARAIGAGIDVLKKGGPALDAVEPVIVLMEDDPMFNAGRGAVFTAEGRNELDAAIMDGRTLAAGAIAGVTRTRRLF
jgi:isoaspartyl peptidase/L-asparaginase-like protein (Ntn-hydrolase superfamily)